MSTELGFLWDSAETARFWPAGYDRIILDETDSTMAEARRRADTLTGPTWIMARHQNAGHGRRGRPWVNPAGNFAATLFLRPEGGVASAGLRSFTSACALYQTLAMTASADSLTLKWPNDVLLDGAKVAGILLESAGRGDRVDWLAIGIGVNLVAAPDASLVEAAATPPASLKGATGKTVLPEDFLFWLAAHFADLEATFTRFGFEPIRKLWLAHAARLGQTITARTARDEIVGRFEDVDAQGNLLLVTGTGRRTIAAADVFF